ncbi:MAG: FtsW/RodA/SpoVE family cell cycle protein [Ilumatobacter sp.]|uniref:FtsW/RodA/SpoVE family cell cycle protein n=1 Tax=Ilumatobacter sp. TaxID=1967498 RepID=UPI003919607A
MTASFLSRKPDSGLGNIRASPADPSRNIDWVLLIVQMALAVIGCFIVFSTSRTRVLSDPYAFVNRQVVFAILACVVMAAVMSVDYEFWKERARALYVITIVSLIFLFLLGVASGRDRISFDLGPMNVQPAELAKFTTLLMLAAFLAEERSDEVSYARFLGGLIIVGIPAVLVIVQPDLGSASVIVSIAMGVLLVAGAKVRYIFAISFLSIATVAAAFVGRLVNSYQVARIQALLDPAAAGADDTYQADNAMRALGTGGIWGKGWLQGPLTNDGDIPVMWADFPFAAVGEQFGLVGCAVVLALIAIALIRIWRIAHLSRDLLGTYLCSGVFVMLLWQTFQNVGMTLKIMPVTGLPLPFISYGGSSLIVYFALFGLVQSVHMRRMR